MNYNNIFSPDLQELDEVLNDFSPTGAKRPWREKKMKNELLAMSYDIVNPSKAARLRACGSNLAFRVYPDGTKRLDSMVSCRVRLCPLCSWRRALKTYGNVREITQYIHEKHRYNFILLTLTVKNCEPEKLSKTIDFLFESFNRFCLLKAFKQAVKGWYRALEITHNLADNTYHPHFHIILAVNQSYFTSRDYIPQKMWREMWQNSARLDYAPQVDIRRVKQKQDDFGHDVVDLAGACAEIAKYTVKDSDYIIPDDWDLTIDTVRLLDAALNNRRLIGYGGVFRDVRKLLHLQDEETGDLVNVDANQIDKNDDDYVLQVYYWHSGFRQYMGKQVK